MPQASVSEEKNGRLPRESAGRIMTANIPVVTPETTIEEAEQILSDRKDIFETVNYVYVVDGGGVLKGVVSIGEVFRHPKETQVSEIMGTKLVTVRAKADQESVAAMALKSNLKAIPVVGRVGQLLGVVSSDTILRVLNTEHTEDVLRSAGVSVDAGPAFDIIRAPALAHFAKRLPWLLVGLGGGMVAALVVGGFEEALRTHLVLAAFIPAVVYMADAVGAQTQTLFIRSIALETGLNFRSYLAREVKISILLAIVLGITSFLISLAWQQSFLLGMIIGFSIFSTILMAMAIALALPWMFLRKNIDPAIASGPFATVIRDILSLLIYFGIAQAMLSLSS